MQPLPNPRCSRLILCVADLLQRLRDLGQPPLHDLLLQVLFVVEIFVDVGVAHLQPLRHRHNRELIRPVQTQQFLSRIQNPDARALHPLRTRPHRATDGQQTPPSRVFIGTSLLRWNNFLSKISKTHSTIPTRRFSHLVFSVTQIVTQITLGLQNRENVTPEKQHKVALQNALTRRFAAPKTHWTTRRFHATMTHCTQRLSS